jgi:hypothetical protein
MGPMVLRFVYLFKVVVGVRCRHGSEIKTIAVSGR